MPISDLTGTKWVFNETIEYDSIFPTYDITYKAYYNNGADYDSGTSLFMASEGRPGRTFYGLLGAGLSSFTGIMFPGCIYEDSSTTMTPTTIGFKLDYIEITGGTDATNSNLIAWLEANAEQVVEPAAATFSSFKDISYNATTKALTINGASYTLAATAVGTSVAGGSFSQLTLTSEGVLTIDGVSITLPVYVAPAPDHSIVDNTGGYVLDNSTGYLITTERSTTLTAPTISLADTTLSIVDEDGRSMTYDIHVDDAFARNIEAVTGSTTTFDLENLGLGVGAHIIKAKAKASSLGDSNYSNEVTYTLAGDVVLDQFTLPNDITDFEFIYDA